MQVTWTAGAIDDLERLHAFLAPFNEAAAARAVQALVRAPARLAEAPHIGEQLFEFSPRLVRRLLVGDYELRYEVSGNTVYVLRLWHMREHR
jgi:plasmid stabilization system protein ParE